MIPAYTSNARFVPALTGIRALAALLVLGLHTAQTVPTSLDSLLPFLARGYLGVDFFFILSGFILTHVYLASVAGRQPNAIAIFLWHRFIRLYPVHLTVLAVLAAIVYLAQSRGVVLNSPQSWSVSELFWHLTLLHAWGTVGILGWNTPSWSISAEWFAYLLFPVIAAALWRVRNPVLAVSLAAVILAATAAAYALAHWDLSGSWVGAPALVRVEGEFICGALLGRALAGGLSAKLPAWSGDVVGATALIVYVVGASNGMADFGLVALLALTIAGAASARTFLAVMLGSRPMVWLGEVSYSIYMVHFPALLVMRRLLEAMGLRSWGEPGHLLAYAAAFMLCIALAAALFYVVEHPARTRLRDAMGVFATA